jgi:hypothetical protein
MRRQVGRKTCSDVFAELDYSLIIPGAVAAPIHSITISEAADVMVHPGVPHAHGAPMPNRSQQPKAPKPDANAPAPAVKLSECPNCGRKDVVVFPVIPEKDPNGTHRLVCVHCCPKKPEVA